MSSWLGAIAKGAAYLYGGAGDEEDSNDENKDNNNNSNVIEEKSNYLNSNQPKQTPSINNENAQKYSPKNIYCSAVGELWKFHPKKEEFKTLMPSVKALIITHDTDQYLSSFQIIRSKDGQLLFSETISNDLQIQYNKKNNSMVFAMYNEHKDRLEILSFIFSVASEEEEFKMAIAIKLYETNRKESFNDLIKKQQIKEDEKKYICEAYEFNEDDGIDYDDQDKLELDDDVIMYDMNKKFDNLEIDDNNDEEEEDEEEEEEEEPNKWEVAANKSYIDSPSKKGATNKLITGSKAFNRTYVVREMDSNNSALGYFKHNDENELEYQGKIILEGLDKKSFSPTKVLQYKSDRNMLILNKKKPIISVLNLDKGKIIEEWQTKDIDCGGIQDVTSINKHAQLNDTPCIYGMNNNSLFLIDGRIPKQCKIVESKSKTYKTNTKFNTVSTSGNGFIAVGSSDGNIRLYNDISKRAKTKLPGLGNKIESIEISDDGLWILGTCTDYIMVIPTKVPGTERTGFEGRGLGKLKPHPYILRLKYSDIQKYKLRNIQFTPAHFDCGKNIDEHWIISSTGPYIIKWNFKKLKKSGIVNSYSIRKAETKIIHNEFRFNHNDDLLVTESNSVYTQHSSKKK